MIDAIANQPLDFSQKGHCWVSTKGSNQWDMIHDLVVFGCNLRMCGNHQMDQMGYDIMNIYEQDQGYHLIKQAYKMI